jgi:hypothetical protein
MHPGAHPIRGPHSCSWKVIKTHDFRGDHFLSRLPVLLSRLSGSALGNNLVGQTILGKEFSEDGVSLLGLFVAALTPTAGFVPFGWDDEKSDCGFLVVLSARLRGQRLVRARTKGVAGSGGCPYAST